MAQIEYAFPVEKVHGKISKKHKIGFAHRTASGVNYSTAYGKRRFCVSWRSCRGLSPQGMHIQFVP